MSDLKDLIVTNNPTNAGVKIPAFGRSKEAFLDLSFSREAEARALEIKMVNPITYPELEIMVTRAYQELRRNQSVVGFLLSEAERMEEEAKADALLDKYPEFLKERPKSMDNADTRKAFLTKDSNYTSCKDRVDMLKATESFVDGKIKTMEKLSSFMKKQMDLIIRSGMTNHNMYVTSGGNKK
jgi:lipopolysaccharide biosynthesis regulator YciM